MSVGRLLGRRLGGRRVQQGGGRWLLWRLLHGLWGGRSGGGGPAWMQLGSRWMCRGEGLQGNAENTHAYAHVCIMRRAAGSLSCVHAVLGGASTHAAARQGRADQALHAEHDSTTCEMGNMHQCCQMQRAHHCAHLQLLQRHAQCPHLHAPRWKSLSAQHRLPLPLVCSRTYWSSCRYEQRCQQAENKQHLPNA